MVQAVLYTCKKTHRTSVNSYPSKTHLLNLLLQVSKLKIEKTGAGEEGDQVSPLNMPLKPQRDMLLKNPSCSKQAAISYLQGRFFSAQPNHNT